MARHPELRIMAFHRARAVCSASLVLQLLAGACAHEPTAPHAAHAHGGPTVTPAGTVSSAQVGAVEVLQHGLFRAHYELPLRPMRAGEVAITSPARTLLAHPAGRVAIVDWTFDLVYSVNGSSVPLSALYNHHFVVQESSGVSLSEVDAGAEWPAQLSHQPGVYERLAAANISFNAGPCEYARYIYGGGAEWRGVQRDAAFDAKRSWPPAAAWLTADAPTLWGLNLHIIDLRGVGDVRNCVQCTCAPQPGGGVQCCPDGSRCSTATPDAEDGRYVFRYAVTYTNNTAVLQNTRALIHSVLTTESFIASNGYSCAVEYNPSTCGAVGPEPPGAWVNESTCVGNTTRLAFQWTLPPSMDIDLHYAFGHQHIGAVGISLFTAPPGLPSNFTQLCESLPRYDRGFVVSMSACNFRDAPRRLPRGSTLRVVSSYHAAAAPLKEAAFQLPWQGVMGYMNVEYTLAPTSKFGVITATGAQERPGVTPMVAAAPGPAVAPSAPVCSARALPAGVSRLTATSVANGTPAAVALRSVVLTTSPALFTMEWTIDPSRGEVAITLALNATGRWFGIGLHSPGAGGGMVGADMVVAQLAPGGGVELAEYWADAYARPMRKADSGGGNGLNACAFASSPAGGARVTFTRPLRGAADARSADVVPGARASVAWAVGAGPTLAPHAAAGRVPVMW